MPKRIVWRIITHHADKERLLKWSFENGQIALGWNAVGDLRQYKSAKEVSAAVVKRFPHLPNRHFGGVQLWNFYRTLQPGDLVILSTGGRREAVMEVTGGYAFAGDTVEDDYLYAHRRSAKQRLDLDAEVLWRYAGGADLAPGQNIRWAFVQCGTPVDADTLPN